MTSLPTRWFVYKGDQVVLEVRDQPGPIVSTSAPPPLPGDEPVVHPFLSASAFDAESEGELGSLLRECDTLEGYLDALRERGYRVELTPWPD